MADILGVGVRDIEGAEKLSSLFSDISEESKTMVLVYLSALRDKEIADRSKRLQEAQRGGEGSGRNSVSQRTHATL